MYGKRNKISWRYVRKWGRERDRDGGRKGAREKGTWRRVIAGRSKPQLPLYSPWHRTQVLPAQSLPPVCSARPAAVLSIHLPFPVFSSLAHSDIGLLTWVSVSLLLHISYHLQYDLSYTPYCWGDIFLLSVAFRWPKWTCLKLDTFSDLCLSLRNFINSYIVAFPRLGMFLFLLSSADPWVRKPISIFWFLLMKIDHMP